MQVLRKLRGHRDLFAHGRYGPRHLQRGLDTGPTTLRVCQDALDARIWCGEGVVATVRAARATIGRRANWWPRKEFGERAGGAAEMSRQVGCMLHGWGGAALNPVPQRKVLAVDVLDELFRRLDNTVSDFEDEVKELFTNLKKDEDKKQSVIDLMRKGKNVLSGEKGSLISDWEIKLAEMEEGDKG